MPIPRESIAAIARSYSRPAIATICSHSALQIFHGAKAEGFRTVGICTPDKREFYESYPLARPDEFIEVAKYGDVLSPEIQRELVKKNCVVVPHGSFVEYVGSDRIAGSFAVPMFGNRGSLQWESSRAKCREWLTRAKCRVPKEFSSPSQIDRICIVKFSGAKGGKGFFLTTGERDFARKMKEKVEKKIITQSESENSTIQEFINGVRYYHHYFYSPLENDAYGKPGRMELLSMDKRLESNADEIYRIMAAGTLQELNITPTYVVTGNSPLTIRESLLPEVYSMGKRVAESSKKLFDGGIVGPYCIETVVTPELHHYAFEISARIVAGTNLYPQGSFLSWYLFNEPMSTGRRIAREIKNAVKQKRLADVVY
ncbi:MAG: formate--phosphoribosylaminoimidazolecarboxamide ligase [Candidatus Micrarchaeota archaeon]